MRSLLLEKLEGITSSSPLAKLTVRYPRLIWGDIIIVTIYLYY